MNYTPFLPGERAVVTIFFFLFFHDDFIFFYDALVFSEVSLVFTNTVLTAILSCCIMLYNYVNKKIRDPGLTSKYYLKNIMTDSILASL